MSEPTEDRWSVLLPDGWLIAGLALIAAIGAAQAATLPTNGDVAWLLHTADRTLDGARPYVDVVETNPPWVIVLNIGFAGLSRLLGVGIARGFVVELLALIGLSLALTWRLSRGMPEGLRRVGLLTWAYLLLVHIGAMFGQREHLLEILILPYVFGVIAEARGDRTPRGLAIVVGLMAGCGFALKPYFVPALLALEGYLAWRRGVEVWRRPQVFAIASVFAVYAVALATCFAGFFDAARRFAPLYLNYHLDDVFGGGNVWRVPLLLLAFMFARSLARERGRGRTDGWADVFGWLATALTLAVALGGRGWLYHWLVVSAITLYLLVGAVALILADKSATWRRRAGIGLIAAIPCCGALTYTEIAPTAADDDAAVKVVREVAGDGRGSILVLSGCPDVALTLDTGARWGMRHPFLWPLPAFYKEATWRPGQYRKVVEMEAAERRFVGEIAEDFARDRPSLVLVDCRAGDGPFRDFDYLQYMSQVPTFAANFREYEYLKSTTCFQIYRRRDEAEAAPSRSSLASRAERSTTVTELSDMANAATIGP